MQRFEEAFLKCNRQCDVPGGGGALHLSSSKAQALPYSFPDCIASTRSAGPKLSLGEAASCHRPQLRPVTAHGASSPQTPLSGRPLFACELGFPGARQGLITGHLVSQLNGQESQDPGRKGAGHRAGCGGRAGPGRPLSQQQPQNDLACRRLLLPNSGIHSSA